MVGFHDFFLCYYAISFAGGCHHMIDKYFLNLLTPLSYRRWYAKRFLHPNIVAAYEYIFIWDEDLGVEHFNAEE